MDETHAFDNDGGVLVGEHVASAIGEHYDNAEIRLSGHNDWADWVVGAFYFDAFGYFHATNYSVVGSAVRAVDTTYEPNSKALYATATVRPFGDRLGVVLGGRYSWDHKFVDYSNYNDVPPHPNSSDIIFQVTPKQKKFNWKAGLNYEVSDDALVYASAATGKPAVGNQQLEPLPGGPPGSTKCSTTPVAAGTGLVCLGRTYYVNQPATIRGFELEYTVNPVDRLLINGSVGWSKFTSPDIKARVVNKRQNNPFWTANAGIQYEILADGIGGSV